MRLAGVWRYPVKSMQGEAMERADLHASGMAGDRRWGVQARDSGYVLSAKREGRLLTARATTAAGVHISLPTGESIGGAGPEADAALSAWLGRDVALIEARPGVAATFVSQSDDGDDGSDSVTFEGRPGAFVDSSPLHVITTASLRAMSDQRPDLDWGVRRFRPNLVVDAGGGAREEDGWVGRRFQVGEATLEVIKPCRRCVMITRAQPDPEGDRPGGYERQLGLLTHLNETVAGSIGVLARVVHPDKVAVGDPVSLS